MRRLYVLEVTTNSKARLKIYVKDNGYLTSYEQPKLLIKSNKLLYSTRCIHIIYFTTIVMIITSYVYNILSAVNQ